MQIDCNLMRLYHLNQSTDEPWNTIYLTLYVVFTLACFVCNALLLLAVYRHNRKQQRVSSTPIHHSLRHVRDADKTRDALIAHLATFNLLLSFILPFTALDVLSKFWPLGSDTQMVCRLVKSVPPILVYSSSMTIVVIAINCYRQIICPSKQQLLPTNFTYITPTILFIAILMSSPIFYFSRLYSIFEPEDSNLTPTTDLPNVTPVSKVPTLQTFSDSASTVGNNISAIAPSDIEEPNLECNVDEYFNEYDWSHVAYCIEDWPFNQENDLVPTTRVYYSLFSLIFQLIIPGVIISCSYFLIYLKLHKPSITRRRSTILSLIGFTQDQDDEHIEYEMDQSKQRNKRMAVISMIFVVSMLPLSIIGTLLDAYPNFLGNDIEVVTIVFMTCHLIGISSACANPIIYAYSNKHIHEGKNYQGYI